MTEANIGKIMEPRKKEIIIKPEITKPKERDKEKEKEEKKEEKN